MAKYRQWLAGVLAALTVLVVLSSSVFLIEHADHDCAGEDCPVCQQLFACVQSLKNLAAAALIGLAAAFFAAFMQICADRRLPDYTPRTPVALKVKLSN